ncbi:thiol-disulfide oxidoreductase DCC family protein [Pontibacter actiniarum]|uniref:Thiol-disulfide oxidoreductase n=1 Tax=Pontibacter actiniarum TaxID=323450 RepID=A0A1X9YWT6_9BACT|nr:DUF393 domain-containing protein [Pontibacter actiniarum]ARS37328.1 hypothetical protein CA264_18940 [Pontibacter actiniarum]
MVAKQGSSPAGVAAPPRPVLVYDGDCSFCKYWVHRWQHRTQGRVQYVPFQEVPDRFYGISHTQFRQSVYLITRYGQRLHGAEAVAVLLQLSGYGTWSGLYYRLPFVSTVAEAGYRLVANHRDFFFKLTQLFFRTT